LADNASNTGNHAELRAQGAQAVRDTGLVTLSQRCHPHTLRQMKWANAMLKTLSPQVLAT
jgi:hypothetical protein